MSTLYGNSYSRHLMFWLIIYGVSLFCWCSISFVRLILNRRFLLQSTRLNFGTFGKIVAKWNKLEYFEYWGSLGYRTYEHTYNLLRKYYVWTSTLHKCVSFEFPIANSFDTAVLLSTKLQCLFICFSIKDTLH